MHPFHPASLDRRAGRSDHPPRSADS